MNIRKIIFLFAMVVLVVACDVRAGLISATFDNSGSGGSWSSATGTAAMAAANQAIADWTNQLALQDGLDVNIKFELINNSTVGLANWVGAVNYNTTSGALPWSPDMTHTISINLYNDQISFAGTPLTGYYDGLSVFRHEIAHALGFADGLFGDTALTPGVDLWANQINTSDVFTGGGLNVPMATADLMHVAGSSDLMAASFAPNQRYDISTLDARMLSAAYSGYTLVPEPVTALLLLCGGVTMLLRRPKNPRR